MNNSIIPMFNQFMHQVKGLDPNALINQLLSSGKINQQQINQAHQRAKEMENELKEIRKNFGF